MSQTRDTLITMANQIARFFQSQGSFDLAAAETAQHIKDFWAPRMRRELDEMIAAGEAAGLSPIAVEAMHRLK